MSRLSPTKPASHWDGGEKLGEGDFLGGQAGGHRHWTVSKGRVPKQPRGSIPDPWRTCPSPGPGSRPQSRQHRQAGGKFPLALPRCPGSQLCQRGRARAGSLGYQQRVW